MEAEKGSVQVTRVHPIHGDCFVDRFRYPMSRKHVTPMARSPVTGHSNSDCCRSGKQPPVFPIQIPSWQQLTRPKRTNVWPLPGDKLLGTWGTVTTTRNNIRQHRALVVSNGFLGQPVSDTSGIVDLLL